MARWRWSASGCPGRRIRAKGIRLHALHHRLPGMRRHRVGQVIGTAVGAASQDLASSGSLDRRVGDQADARDGPLVELGGANGPSGNKEISALRPRSRAAMSSSSRNVPWLIMICRENGSVSGSRRVRSQRSRISPGVRRSTSHHSGWANGAPGWHSQNPAPCVRLGAGPFPRGDGILGHLLAAGGAGCGDQCDAASRGQANEVSSIHVAALPVVIMTVRARFHVRSRRPIRQLLRGKGRCGLRADYALPRFFDWAASLEWPVTS